MRHFNRVVLAGIAMATAAQAQPQGSANRAVPFSGYLHTKPALGDLAPDFVLHDVDGKEVRLRDFTGKRPIVIEFGSYS